MEFIDLFMKFGYCKGFVDNFDVFVLMFGDFDGDGKSEFVVSVSSFVCVMWINV